MTLSPAIFSGLSGLEFLILLILGILLYGKNLPTVARTVGRTIGEFKRHLRTVEDQIKREAYVEEMNEIRELKNMDPFKDDGKKPAAPAEAPKPEGEKPA